MGSRCYLGMEYMILPLRHYKTLLGTQCREHPPLRNIFPQGMV